jgi:transposase
MYQQRIEQLDQQIEKQLQCYQAKGREAEQQIPKQAHNKKQSPQRHHTDKADSRAAKGESEKKAKKKKDKNHPPFDVRGYLQSIHGVDVVAIPGLSETGGLEILAETGTDLSKWETDGHFLSWLNLVPNTKISGGKVLSSKVMKRKANAASQAFRYAANAVQRSDNWLGEYFRRMKAKGGNKYAVMATAGKIASIYYKMVRNKEAFRALELEVYQQKYKQAKMAYLQRTLDRMKQEQEAAA